MKAARSVRYYFGKTALRTGNAAVSLPDQRDDAVMSETVGAIGNLGRVHDDAGVRVRREIENNLPAVKFLFCCFLFALAFLNPCFASESHASDDKIPKGFSGEHPGCKSASKADKSGNKGIRLGDESPESNKKFHDETLAFLCFFAIGFNFSILVMIPFAIAIGDEIWEINVERGHAIIYHAKEKNQTGRRKNDQC